MDAGGARAVTEGARRRATTVGIQGNLATMALPDLLQWLANNRSSGTLEISNGSVDKAIYFLRGRIVSSQSTDPLEYLGHFLVRNKLISEGDLAEGMRLQSERHALLGRILVERDMVSSEDLDRMLVLKARETIFDLFTWEEGEFRFLEDDLPKREMVPISMEVTDVLLAGLDRQEELAEIQTVFPSMQSVPVAVVPDLPARETEDEGQRAVLRLVDDRRTVAEIAMEAHATEFFVCSTLLPHVAEKAVKVVRPRVLAAEQRTGTISGASLVREAANHQRDGQFEAALRRLRAAVSLEPHDPDLRRDAAEIEARIQEAMRSGGLSSGATPRIVATTQQLTAVELAPEEGFVLSRIDGRAEVESLLKISPLPETEAMVVLWKLWESGLIAVERT